MFTLTSISLPARTVLVSLFALSLCLLSWRSNFSPSEILHRRPSNNYAYALFLAAPWDVKSPNATDDEDHYFMQTRMLLYSLLHDPATRSNKSYPVVVLVTEDVAQHKRERLAYEGAIVKEVEKLNPLQHKTRKAWKDVLTKLRLFEMIEYDKVAFFDSDTLITRPIDGIFDDAAAQPQSNKNLTKINATMADEAPQPHTYLFASNAGSAGYNHTIPPEKGDNLNAGCLVFQPSIDLFNYYVSLTTPTTETRYNGRYPEQSLWAYAHRRDGNMPWKQLHWKWNTNWARWEDLEVGTASLHSKYWELDHDPKLRDYAFSIMWRMEGYWEGVARRGRR